MAARRVSAKLQLDNEKLIRLSTRQQFFNLAFESVLNSLTGSEQKLRPIYVRNPLASASLLCSYIRHKVIRKHESTEKMSRRIFRLFGPRNKIWSAIEPVFPKRILLDDTVASLKARLPVLEAGRPEDYEEANKILGRLEEISKELLESKEAYQATSLFPSMKPRLLDPSLPWSSAYIGTAIQGNTSALRGLMIKITGPKKDTKAGSIKKQLGASSLNSVGLISGEMAQAQLPSKVGIFGLKVRIAYTLKSRLASLNTKVLAMTVPKYKLDTDLLGRPMQEATVFGFSNSMNQNDISLLDEQNRLCDILDSY